MSTNLTSISSKTDEYKQTSPWYVREYKALPTVKRYSIDKYPKYKYQYKSSASTKLRKNMIMSTDYTTTLSLSITVLFPQIC